MRLSDKVVIVQEHQVISVKVLQRDLSEEGAKTILVARNLEGLEKARKDIGNEDSTVQLLVI